jgi:hypothetical protein
MVICCILGRTRRTAGSCARRAERASDQDDPNDAELTLRALQAGGFDPLATEVDTPAEE